jgi:hypothetical protein
MAAVTKENVGQFWHDWFMTDAYSVEKTVQRFMHILPQDPRGKLCYSPFEVVGGLMVGGFFAENNPD